MAKLGELASPVMRSTTRLQRYPAPGMGCKEVQKLSSTDPLAKYRSTPLIRSVNVKDVLGDIQTDYDNFRHGRLPQVVLNTSTLAHRCRRGRLPHHKCVATSAFKQKRHRHETLYNFHSQIAGSTRSAKCDDND
jgi:hypothetical protein